MGDDDDYRALLIERELRVGEGYDKTLITLSGGALGLTVTFTGELVGEGAIVGASWLLGAWIAWSVSLGSLLSAYYFGRLSYKQAREQLDEYMQQEENQQAEQPDYGAPFSRYVEWLNAVGGVSFFGGLVSIVWFSFLNLG